MEHWLTRLRKKPKGMRNQYAFFGAAGITLCITVVWLAAAPLSFNAPDVSATKNNSSGAFSQFWNNVSTQIATVWKSNVVFPESLEDNKSEEVPTLNIDAPKPINPAVVVPKLDSSTILKSKPARTVLIGTSSSAEVY